MNSRQREIKSVWLILERRGKLEVFVVQHTMTGNCLTQANFPPKTKNYLIKGIFILTARVGRWQLIKRAVGARMLIVRSPKAQINSSGVKCLWLF